MSGAEPELLTEERDTVLVLRLNRPRARNALSTALMEAISRELERASTAQVRCVVITGDDDAFASGAELETIGDAPAAAALETASRAFWASLADCPLPLIAAVRGWALGAGCELALACDLLIADEKAVFGFPEVTLGTIPGGGGTQRLAKLAGRRRATELIATGRRFYVPEAREIGLVNQVSKSGSCLSDALVMAETIAERPPMAVRAAKRAVAAAEALPLAEGLELERELRESTIASHDRLEAVRALAEKRRPEFGSR